MSRRKFEDDIFEDYIERFISDRSKIKDYYLFDTDQIIVEHLDGNRYLYDYMNKTLRALPNDEDLSEEKWRYEFSQRLLKKMDLSGIGQDLLSQRTGLSRPMISYYIRGRSIPNIYNAEKIARALGCSVEELLHFPK